MTDYDNLHICEVCGDAYTLGRLCTSCQRQADIDSADIAINGIYDPTADDDTDEVEVDYNPEDWAGSENWEGLYDTSDDDEYDDDDDDGYYSYSDDLEVVLMMGNSIYADNWHGVFCHARNVVKAYMLNQWRRGWLGRTRHKIRYLFDSEYRTLYDNIPF